MTQAEREAKIKFDAECPVIRMDENFIDYIVENNNYFNKLLKRKKLKLKMFLLAQRILSP